MVLITQKQVKQHRLPCKAEMVRAFIKKEKSQTRRLNGLKEINKNPGEWSLECSRPTIGEFFLHNIKTRENRFVYCPYGKVGDIILITETWRTFGFIETVNEEGIRHPIQIAYRANTVNDMPYFLWRDVEAETYKKYTKTNYFKWHTGRFMPAFASRIKREIADIRPQRLGDISEEDAIAEGCIANFEYAIIHGQEDYRGLYAKDHYAILWDTIYPKLPWSMSPWVWALTTKPVK